MTACVPFSVDRRACVLLRCALPQLHDDPLAGAGEMAVELSARDIVETTSEVLAGGVDDSGTALSVLDTTGLTEELCAVTVTKTVL